MLSLGTKNITLNPYERLHNKFATSNLKQYNEDDWFEQSRNGQLDTYVTALSMASEKDETWHENFTEKYNYDFADSYTRINALYNEFFADKEKLKPREWITTNPETGAEETMRANMSDYDYFQMLIKARNDANKSEYYRDLLQKEKENVDFGKIMYTIGDTALFGVFKGTLEMLDDISAIFANIGKNPDEYVKNVAEGSWLRPFINGIEKHEAEFSYLYDVDGNAVGFGKYVTGITETIGEMAPSFLVSTGVAKGLQAVHVGAKATSTVADVISTAVFYTGVTAMNIREQYNNFARQGVSVPGAQIIANSVVKSVAQWAIEEVLGRIGGASTMDNLAFGRAMKANKMQGTLMRKAAKQLLEDFHKEGREEFWQDFSDIIVDQIFTAVTDYNFGGLENFNWQNLMDSYIIGGLTSVITTTGRIMATSRVATSETTYLNKLASWQFKMDLQSMMEATNSIITLAKKSSLSNKVDTEITEAFQTVYNSYSLLAKYVSTIGQDRLKAANDILNLTQEMYDAHQFDRAYVATNAIALTTSLIDTVSQIEEAYKQTKKQLKETAKTEKKSYSALLKERKNEVAKKLADANVTEIKDVHVSEEAENLAEAAKNTQGKEKEKNKKLAETLNGSDEKTAIVFTNGTKLVVDGNVFFVPDRYFEQVSPRALYSTAAENKLVDKVLTAVKNNTWTLNLAGIVDLCKQLTGDTEVNDEQAIWLLLYDSTVYNCALYTGDKNVYDLLIKLRSLQIKNYKQNLDNVSYQQKLQVIINNMTACLAQYCMDNTKAPIPDFLTDIQKQQINVARYGRNVGINLIDNGWDALNKNEQDVLTQRVNNLPITGIAKANILSSLKSGTRELRDGGLAKINDGYAKIFRSKYDGVTYAPMAGVGNHAFNRWLQTNGLTISTLLKDSNLEERQTQFNTFVNGQYNFALTDDGKFLGVFDKVGTQIGFNAEWSAVGNLDMGALSDKTIVGEKVKQNLYISQIMDKSIDDFIRSVTSINDLITHPEMLSENIKNAIRATYVDVNEKTAFLYLRNYYLNRKGNEKYSIVVNTHGEYVFASVVPMESLLTEKAKKGIEFTDKLKISDIIDSSHLAGNLANIQIKCAKNADDVAMYDFRTNTIYINKTAVNFKNAEYRKFAILHEFQHAIQYHNNLNLGLNYKWTNYLTQHSKQELVNDVKKHRPELFKNAKDFKEQLQVANDFVYYASAEHQAYGLEASSLTDYYPVIVQQSAKEITTITLPWGRTIDIEIKKGQSLYGSRVQLTKEEEKEAKENANKFVQILKSSLSKFGQHFAISNIDIMTKLTSLYFNLFSMSYEAIYNMIEQIDDYELVYNAINAFEWFRMLSSTLDERSISILKQLQFIMKERLTYLETTERFFSSDKFTFSELSKLYKERLDHTDFSAEHKAYLNTIMETAEYIDKLAPITLRARRIYKPGVEGFYSGGTSDIKYEISMRTGMHIYDTRSIHAVVHEIAHLVTVPLLQYSTSMPIVIDDGEVIDISASAIHQLLRCVQLYSSIKRTYDEIQRIVADIDGGIDPELDYGHDDPERREWQRIDGKEYIVINGGLLEKYYGFTNVHEFIAESTNEQFVDFLNSTTLSDIQNLLSNSELLFNFLDATSKEIRITRNGDVIFSNTLKDKEVREFTLETMKSLVDSRYNRQLIKEYGDIPFGNVLKTITTDIMYAVKNDTHRIKNVYYMDNMREEISEKLVPIVYKNRLLYPSFFAALDYYKNAVEREDWNTANAIKHKLVEFIYSVTHKYFPNLTKNEYHELFSNAYMSFYYQSDIDEYSIDNIKSLGEAVENIDTRMSLARRKAPPLNEAEEAVRKANVRKEVQKKKSASSASKVRASKMPEFEYGPYKQIKVTEKFIRELPKGNPLKAYYRKGDTNFKMNSGMVYFITHATSDIDEGLWRAIRQTKLRDVRQIWEWIRQGEYIKDGKYANQKTFDLINKAFFNNPNITSFEHLEELVNNADEFYSIYQALKYTKDLNNSEKYSKLYEIFADSPENNVGKSVKDLQIRLNSLQNILASDKKWYKSYQDAGKRFEGTMSFPYTRLKFLREFDGTVSTAGAIVSTIYSLKQFNQDITGDTKDTSIYSTIGAKKSDDRSTRTLLETLKRDTDVDTDDDNVDFSQMSAEDFEEWYDKKLEKEKSKELTSKQKEKLDSKINDTLSELNFSNVLATLFDEAEDKSITTKKEYILSVFTASELISVIDKLGGKEVLKKDAVKLKKLRAYLLGKVKQFGENVDAAYEYAQEYAKKMIDLYYSHKLDQLYVYSVVRELLNETGEQAKKAEADYLAWKIAAKTMAAIGTASKHGARIRKTTNTINAHLKKSAKTKTAVDTFMNEYSHLFDRKGNTVTVKEELYGTRETYKVKDKKTGEIVEKSKLVYKDVEEVKKVADLIKEISTEVQKGVFSNKSTFDTYKKSQDKLNKTVEDILKTSRKLLEKTEDDEVPKTVTKIVITDQGLPEKYEVATPTVLRNIIDKDITETGEGYKANVSWLESGDAMKYRMNLENFFEANAEELMNMDQGDVQELADFLLSDINWYRDSVRLNAIRLYLMTYLVASGRNVSTDITFRPGTENKKLTIFRDNFVLSAETLQALDEKLSNIVSNYAKGLNNWHAAMRMLTPLETVYQSLAQKRGVDIPKRYITNLAKAVESGNPVLIAKARDDAFNNATALDNTKRPLLDRLLDFQRAAMLSGPGTWFRNQVSNIALYYGGKGAEQTGKWVVSMLNKTLKPEKRAARANQYKIIGTKVDAETKAFVKQNFIDTGLMDAMLDASTKYDGERKTFVTSNDRVTNIFTQAIANRFNKQHVFSTEMLTKAYTFVFNMISDDPWIKKATIEYFEKTLVEDKVDLKKAITAAGISLEVVNKFVDAYLYATQEFMHKSNSITKMETNIKKSLENRTSKKFANAVYFMYKQVFPFAGASWNWFLEGLNWTTAGLIWNIKEFYKVEKTVEKLASLREHGSTSAINERFVQYMVTKNIGKGVIGSVGTLVGILLALFGLAGVDDKDGKLKIRVGDEANGVYFDVSNILSSQGIMEGIILVSSIKSIVKGEDFLNVVADALDIMFEDSVFTDVYSAFRKGFGDLAVYQPFRSLDMFVPNFIKQTSALFNVYKVKYDKGAVGYLERALVDAIPGIAYAFPHYTDVYTGETQMAYKGGAIGNVLLNLINKGTPLKIYPYDVTDIEKTAISLGVKAGQLIGSYEVGDDKISLNATEAEKLNQFYGKLNEKDLTEFMNNKKAYKVQKEDGTYEELKYSKMSDKQKKAVIERIMSHNSSLARIYILTSEKSYKYYASESEYKELKSLGISNLYHEKTVGKKKISGLVKSN